MAKDKNDTGRTRDFITGASAAQRQRAFASRMKERGYYRRTVWLHRTSWYRGHAAGQAGSVCAPPSDVEDRLAWMSGYIEGAANPLEELSG